MPKRQKTIDFIETLALTRLMRWQSWVTTGVCPENYYIRSVVENLTIANLLFCRDKMGLNIEGAIPEQIQKHSYVMHPDWIYLFLINVYNIELFSSIWGRLFLSWLTPSPFDQSRKDTLKLPFILHPTHCPFCGVDLLIRPENFKKVQMKCGAKECENQWQGIRNNLQRAVSLVMAFKAEPDTRNKDMLKQMACIWESYQDFCRFWDKADKHYTPRYTLFPEYREESVSKSWYHELLCDYPVDLSKLPMFTPEIQGKILIDGSSVFSQSEIEQLPSNHIRFNELDDEKYFIFPKKLQRQKAAKRTNSNLEHIF